MSENSLPKKKNVWNSMSRMISRNRSEGSTGADNGSLKRPSTPSTPTGHGTEMHVSPPPNPTSNPRASQSCGPELKRKYSFRSYRRKRKASGPAEKIEAFEGESVTSRHNIGTASIDGEFYKIEYGQFKERPACLIIVDVTLVYPPDDTIDKAKLEFQFAKDDEQSLSPEDHDSARNARTPISKVFAPNIIEGMPSDSKKTIHHHNMPIIEGLSFKIDTGGRGDQTTTTKQHRWRVLGRTEEHNGIYDTFGWNIYQNEALENSVPRQVRLGMIAFHRHQPFCVNVTIEGSTRQKQKHRRQKATQEKRWFHPPKPEDVGRHVLQEAMVENLVSKQNRLIRDIALSRLMGATTVNPIDVAEFGELSGVAGTGIDGGGVVTDSLSIEDVALDSNSFC